MRWVVGCGACGAELPVSAGRALVTARGVVLVCPPCRLPGPAAASVVEALVETPRRPWPWALAAAAALFLVLPARDHGAARGSPANGAATALVDDDLGPDDVARHVQVAPAEPPPADALGRGFADDEAVELIWYHPLAGTRRLPARGDRRFGAERAGPRPAECGGGHCGVDLGESIGEVVHAALPGVVRQVNRDETRRGGRYVVVDHPGGYATYYFHLDRLHPDLVPGIGVAAGEALGTLGTTGILHSAPHLHFGVERVVRGEPRFVDPEPMLRRAIILDTPAPIPDAREPALVPATTADDTGAATHTADE